MIHLSQQVRKKSVDFNVPPQHSQCIVVSALTERINLDRSPTCVLLDSGCTPAMGSRYAVNRLIKGGGALCGRQD